jgi:hypothetical protein
MLLVGMRESGTPAITSFSLDPEALAAFEQQNPLDNEVDFEGVIHTSSGVVEGRASVRVVGVFPTGHGAIVRVECCGPVRLAPIDEAPAAVSS